MAEKNNKGVIIQFIMLMLLLVATPIGTYFWMRGGVDYRMERLSELKDYGKVGDFSATDIDGEVFTRTELEKKMVLVTFLPNNKADAKKLVERIELVEHQMEEQLDQRKDMLFLFYTTATDLVTVYKDLTKKENDKFEFITVTQSEWDRVKDEVYNVKASNHESNKNTLALVDLQGLIRHYYDAMENVDMGKLVEHMAIILPPVEQKDIIFRREKEK